MGGSQVGWGGVMPFDNLSTSDIQVLHWLRVTLEKSGCEVSFDHKALEELRILDILFTEAEDE